MLAYFPIIYPGELLYSVLAHYHKHVGSPGPMHTQETLFGSRNAIATFDLPGHLQILAQRIPPDRGLDVSRIIDTLTLYPYFTAFEPPRLQAKVRQAMQRGMVENLHLRLGLAAFRVARITRLRFCLECVREMYELYGELYWRREHQLPSVRVCPEHGSLLLESAVSLSKHSRHEFIAATHENCSLRARPVVPAIDQAALPHLHRLARLSVDLLNNPPAARSFSGWTLFYRSRMQEIGLARSSVTMDQQRFQEEFRSFYGRTLHILPNVLEDSEFAGDWLSAMVRKHRKANHPLYHLLVQDYIRQRGPHISAFGAGPWPCLNPLAQHRSSAPIKNITLHRNHGKVVGVFACACGYVYTRCFNPVTGKVGAPRFLEYGPLVEQELRRLIAARSSLRETGRTLQLDPKTVVRLARDLSIAVPWKIMACGHHPLEIGSESRQMPVEKPVPEMPVVTVLERKATDRMRQDWHEIDQAWVTQIKELSATIRVENPPLRITVAELERRVGRRGWLLKRRHRLPMTMELLNHTIETIDEYQLRRIYWAISELERDGAPFKAWQVMRKAGLRSSNLERINQLLERVPAIWGAAA